MANQICKEGLKSWVFIEIQPHGSELSRLHPIRMAAAWEYRAQGGDATAAAPMDAEDESRRSLRLFCRMA